MRKGPSGYTKFSQRLKTTKFTDFYKTKYSRMLYLAILLLWNDKNLGNLNLKSNYLCGYTKLFRVAKQNPTISQRILAEFDQDFG
jgi:hypothetical protein